MVPIQSGLFSDDSACFINGHLDSSQAAEGNDLNPPVFISFKPMLNDRNDDYFRPT